MPELPEVETVVSGLSPALSGKLLKSIRTFREGVRLPFPKDLPTLQGRSVTGLSRRAKYILIFFDDDILAIHLGMSGRMTIHRDAASYKPLRHDHMIMTMDDGTSIVFNDPRRFGMVLLLGKDALLAHKSFKDLGPEPLERAFTGGVFHHALRTKASPIKTVLLDQRVVVGVGNIYACEALFEAGIDPRRKASTLDAKEAQSLVATIKSVLKRAIRAGGSSLKDYRQADGSLGYFQHRFLVYGREGEPCPRCVKGGKKGAVIHRITQAGRSTFYCPACQK